ncbi:MAG: chromosomal replication initiator protein DnaA [Candidatus Glassbacteria bacterium]
MELSPQEIWTLIKDRSKESINSRSFETWIMPTRGISMSEDVLMVETDSKFAADYIQERYRPILESCASYVLDKNIMIMFTTSSKNNRKDSIHRFVEAPFRKKRRDINLNSRYTFDSFVVGSNNQLAHAASLAVSESPAKRYNPLFIYGGTGLGKTHLMQAIGNSVVSNCDSISVFYASAEFFMNELIQSIQQGNTSNFRNKYRKTDMLLIDDVHFLAYKEGTQEEFFHTFNSLYDSQKQIVLTSDRPPNEIPTLEERLVSRFGWGLVVDIQPPDFETRTAILRKKAEEDKLFIPDDVLDFIAENIKTNVRDLESSLIRLLARSSLTRCEITIDLARSVLKDILSKEAKRISIDKIQKVVSKNYGVSVESLKSKSRTKGIILPRQIAMYIARQLTTMPLVEIGETFGHRDHSTVLHSCDKVKSLIDKDENIRRDVKRLIDLSRK